MPDNKSNPGFRRCDSMPNLRDITLSPLRSRHKKDGLKGLPKERRIHQDRSKVFSERPRLASLERSKWLTD